jgi:hypothetical protein
MVNNLNKWLTVYVDDILSWSNSGTSVPELQNEINKKWQGISVLLATLRNVKWAHFTGLSDRSVT